MTDRERFVYHICKEPAVDLHRLVYADWLDEQPLPECPYCEGKGSHNNPFSDYSELRDKCVACNGTGKDQADRKKAAFIRASIADGRRVYRKLGDIGVGLRGGLDAYLADSTAVAMEPMTPGLVWHRGFVCEVRMIAGEYFRLLKVLFRSYPIQRMVLTNVIGSETAPRDRYRINVHNIPKFLPMTAIDPPYFPEGMKPLLRDGTKLNDYGDRRYDSASELLEDVSLACVTFGRVLAHLDDRYKLNFDGLLETVS